VAQAKGVACENIPVEFKELDYNAGFARANNLGIKAIKAQCPECHIMLLNPDTSVTSGSIGALLGLMNQEEDVAVAGPKLLNQDGSLQVSVRNLPSAINLLFTWFKLQRLLPESRSWKRYMQTDFDYEREQDVEQVMGAAFMVSTKAIKEIGLLDEDFWIWFEEVDYCKRALDAGMKVRYTPRGQIMHYGGVSFSQLDTVKKARPWVKSSLRYARKHLGVFNWIVMILLSPFALLLSVLVSLIRRYASV
jgi:GT2 family glycosyltransferase